MSDNYYADIYPPNEEEDEESSKEKKMVTVQFNSLEVKVVAQALRDLIKLMQDSEKYDKQSYQNEIAVARSALFKLENS